MPERRHLGADALDHVAEEARAILEAAAVSAGAAARAEQLVAEVAVAVLDVDELKADLVRVPARRRRSRPPADRCRRLPGRARRPGTGDRARDWCRRRAARAGSTRWAGRSGRSASAAGRGRDRIGGDAEAFAMRVRRDRRAATRARSAWTTRAAAGWDWHGRRGEPQPPRLPRSAWRRSRRTGASGGGSDRSAGRRACRPSLPSAGCRSGCRCGRDRRRVAVRAASVPAASARRRSPDRCRGARDGP